MEENKMNNKQPERKGVDANTLPEGTQLIQIDKQLKKDIAVYLGTRPYFETDFLLKDLFSEESIESEQLWLEQGFKILIEYLGKCPRNEVKGLIEQLLSPEKVKSLVLKKKEEPESAE